MKAKELLERAKETISLIVTTARPSSERKAKALQLINQAIATLDEQPCDWIPVSERLPEEFTFVLVTNGNSFRRATLKEGKYWKFCCVGWQTPITHWKPIVLPKPSCSECGGSGKQVRTFTGGCGLETRWRAKADDGYRQDEERNCPACQSKKLKEAAARIAQLEAKNGKLLNVCIAGGFIGTGTQIIGDKRYEELLEKEAKAAELEREKAELHEALKDASHMIYGELYPDHPTVIKVKNALKEK